MTSLIKPVPQREIEEKKQGSGERTAQILKKKAKGMNMAHNTLLGVLIPFVGTTAGAACVFFLKNELKPIIQKTLLGFASGVMVAASVWSLLIPSMNMCEAMGRLAFLPASIGFMVGILMLLLLDRLIPHLHLGSDEPEGHMCGLKKTTMLVLAVTLHNTRRAWQSEWYLPVLSRKERHHAWQRRWHFHLELRFRTSRRERSFPCRFGVSRG